MFLEDSWTEAEAGRPPVKPALENDAHSGWKVGQEKFEWPFKFYEKECLMKCLCKLFEWFV